MNEDYEKVLETYNQIDKTVFDGTISFTPTYSTYHQLLSRTYLKLNKFESTFINC